MGAVATAIACAPLDSAEAQGAPGRNRTSGSTRRTGGWTGSSSTRRGQAPGGDRLARHRRAARRVHVDEPPPRARGLRGADPQSVLPRPGSAAVRRLRGLPRQGRDGQGRPVAREAHRRRGDGDRQGGGRLSRRQRGGRHRARHRRAGLLHGRAVRGVDRRRRARAGQGRGLVPRRRAGRRGGDRAGQAARRRRRRASCSRSPATTTSARPATRTRSRPPPRPPAGRPRSRSTAPTTAGPWPIRRSTTTTRTTRRGSGCSTCTRPRCDRPDL